MSKNFRLQFAFKERIVSSRCELLAPDNLMPWPAIRRPSSVRRPSVVHCPLLAFHIFDISSKTLRQIELLLGTKCGRYRGDL